jgi:hypothetical protein
MYFKARSQIRFQGITHTIFDEKFGSGTSFSPSSSVFPYQRHSNKCPVWLARWPLVRKFAGSNPAEAVGFFRAKISSARLPSEGK